jgi:hypothetical protein
MTCNFTWLLMKDVLTWGKKLLPIVLPSMVEAENFSDHLRISFVPMPPSSQIICTCQYSRKCGINVVLIYKCLPLWVCSCTVIHFLTLCRVICSKMTCSHQPKWRGSQLWQAHSGSREWTNFHQDRALSHMAWSVVSLCASNINMILIPRFKKL